jgi:hypothetical protein
MKSAKRIATKNNQENGRSITEENLDGPGQSDKETPMNTDPEGQQENTEEEARNCTPYTDLKVLTRHQKSTLHARKRRTSKL